MPSQPLTQTPSATTTPTSPERRATSAEALRVPPHSLDAERALLGAILLDESAIGEALTLLGDLARHVFWSEKHQHLFDELVALWKAGSPLDSVVIKDELERKRMWDALGGYDFLAGLMESVPHAGRVNHYSRLVREKYLLRRLIDATQHVLDLAYHGQTDPGEVLNQAEQRIFAVTEQRVLRSADLLMEEVDALFKRIQDRQPHQGLLTGYQVLDDLTCGLHAEELIVIAGRPSMGKTALGMNIAEHMAFRGEAPVLFFSLEMSRAALAERILCSQARVDAQRLRKARTSAADVQSLQRAAALMNNKPLYVDDVAGLTILELRARARVAHRKHKVQAIFVDYMQLMHAPGKESRQIEVAEISRGLKALAKELHVPVVAMAQLNRNAEERAGNRPRMSDLRESGAIEQDADVIMLLHRESYYKDKQRAAADGAPPPPPGPEDFKAELIVAKQRNGPTGTVELLFDPRFTRFDDFDPALAARYASEPEAEYGSDAPDAF